MTSSAPRIDPRLLAAIADLDRPERAIAETNRHVGQLAVNLGLSRPSYEQVRTVVHAARNGRRVYGLAEAYIDLSFQTAPARVVVERFLAGTPPPERK